MCSRLDRQLSASDSGEGWEAASEIGNKLGLLTFEVLNRRHRISLLGALVDLFRERRSEPLPFVFIADRRELAISAAASCRMSRELSL